MKAEEGVNKELPLELGRGSLSPCAEDGTIGKR
jgi:hypothetical protein